jgi:hypothetical protein
MRTLTLVLVTLWVVVAGGLPPAAAWNDTGHQVVAIIAWDNLSEKARKKAVATLRQAPGDARLASMFGQDGRPLVVREREFFIRASTWPDAIRDVAAYDRPAWHYRDFFWRQENGHVLNLPDASPTPGELLPQLQRIRVLVATTDPAQTRARAVGVAWMLHLIGDMHQPLHCSARVTDQEPRGDGGGNTFKLGMVWKGDHSSMIRDTLHKYWDGAVDKAVPRHANEGTSAHLARAAKAAVNAHPKGSMVNRLKPGQFEEWCRESVGAAQANAYPPGLKRMETPPGAYRGQAAKVAMERVALAGYRLARTLEDLFGQ